MELSRRDFLKITGAGTAGAAAAVALSTIPEGSALAAKQFPLDEWVDETRTICCYCGVGCGALVIRRKSPEFDEVLRIEGDPDHPINEGSLCPKGQAMYQIHSIEGRVDSPINPQRLAKPLHRSPGEADWDEKEWTWEEILDKIARTVKDTRDALGNFTTVDEAGKLVNRHEKMGSLGGGELDNEECYLLSKMDRGLGIVYLEHCARL